MSATRGTKLNMWTASLSYSRSEAMYKDEWSLPAERPGMTSPGSWMRRMRSLYLYDKWRLLLPPLLIKFIICFFNTFKPIVRGNYPPDCPPSLWRIRTVSVAIFPSPGISAHGNLIFRHVEGCNFPGQCWRIFVIFLSKFVLLKAIAYSIINPVQILDARVACLIASDNEKLKRLGYVI